MATSLFRGILLFSARDSDTLKHMIRGALRVPEESVSVFDAFDTVPSSAFAEYDIIIVDAGTYSAWLDTTLALEEASAHAHLVLWGPSHLQRTFEKLDPTHIKEEVPAEEQDDDEPVDNDDEPANSEEEPTSSDEEPIIDKEPSIDEEPSIDAEPIAHVTAFVAGDDDVLQLALIALKPPEQQDEPLSKQALFMAGANRHEAGTFELKHPDYQVVWQCTATEEGVFTKKLIAIPEGIPEELANALLGKEYRASYLKGSFAEAWLDAGVDGLTWLKGSDERLMLKLLKSIAHAWDVQSQKNAKPEEIYLFPANTTLDTEQLARGFFALVWRCRAYDYADRTVAEQHGITRPDPDEIKALRNAYVRALLAADDIDPVAVLIAKQYREQISEGVKTPPFPEPWKFYIALRETMEEVLKIGGLLTDAADRGEKVSLRRWGQLLDYLEYREQRNQG